MSTSVEGKRYSALGILRERLAEKAERDMQNLSVRDLQAVLVWLEMKQFEIANDEVATEDDPVRNAKGRGKVEFAYDLCNELTQMVVSIKSKEGKDV